MGHLSFQVGCGPHRSPVDPDMAATSSAARGGSRVHRGAQSHSHSWHWMGLEEIPNHIRGVYVLRREVEPGQEAGPGPTVAAPLDRVPDDIRPLRTSAPGPRGHFAVLVNDRE